jgi:hypothetical protein
MPAQSAASSSSVPELPMQRCPSRVARAACGLALAAVVAACGGGDPSPGTVRFALTDAPACGFEQVNVSVERVRIHRNADAGESAVGWFEIRYSPARRIDLLKLANGVVEELGSLSLSAGRYVQLRLVLAENGTGTPANSVVPEGGEETALEVPAELKGGIRLLHTVGVEEKKTTDVLFDFDACRSVVPSGSGYLLQPSVEVVPRGSPAISGYVDPAAGAVRVAAQKDGVVLRSTVADANGRFVLAFLDPARSPFDVVFTAAQRTTAVVAAVPLTASAGAELSRMDAPIALPESAARAADGTLGPAAARAGAVVRALQAAGAVAQVEAATANVNAASGAYSLALPTARPRLATYSTRLPLSFAAVGNGGRYTLQAKADGYAAATQAVDVTVADASWSPTLLPQ